jgi:hypothetical protein
MRPVPNRRRLLELAAAAALAASAGPVMGSPNDISGVLTFEGGAGIPKGRIEIYLEDPAIAETNLRRIAETRIESDGASRSIGFGLSPVAGLALPASLQIVARLERADGWLIARGSAPFEAGSSVHIVLNTVQY